MRRVTTIAIVLVPLVWSWVRAVPESGVVLNRGGIPLVDDLLSAAFRPELGGDFLVRVLDATLITVAFATLGTLGALLVGVLGGLVLSDSVWGHRVPWPLRVVRLLLRGLLVAVRSIHELIWALLFVSVLGLDPLVAVLAIAVPFGAQTAKVFGDTLDNVPSEPLDTLRSSGARPAAAVAYALVPASAPLVVSYSFYRLECAIRSAVLLGVVGVGGLGQELVVSLQSRNWPEVWTLVWAVLLLSAVVDVWSARVRQGLAVATCTDWASGTEQVRARGRSGVPRRPSLLAVSGLLLLPATVAAWWRSDLSLAGLTDPRTRRFTGQLLSDMWPPALPSGGWPVLWGAVLDTMAMAVLAMAIAVVLTLLIGPWATRLREDGSARKRGVASLLRRSGWWLARLLLLALRSVPPNVWAVVALLALYPGILPGAVALGLYTGGILGRLLAEAWESLDIRSRDALRAAGVRHPLAAVAALAPPSSQHLVTYTLYRFEICVRDTAVVGVVGAAGLGRLLGEGFATFNFPLVTTLLVASFAVSVAAELVGRRLRRALRP